MLKFTEEHEWLKLDGDVATVGITDHAAEQLGDLVFVELPEVGATVAKGDDAATVESVKAASRRLSRRSTARSPRSIRRSSPIRRWSTPTRMGAGWFFKLKLADPSAMLDGADGRRRLQGVHRLMDDADAVPYAPTISPTISPTAAISAPRPAEMAEMLKVVGAASLDALIDETVPARSASTSRSTGAGR